MRILRPSGSLYASGAIAPGTWPHEGRAAAIPLPATALPGQWLSFLSGLLASFFVRAKHWHRPWLALPRLLTGKVERRSRAFAQQSVYREATWANADGRRLRECRASWRLETARQSDARQASCRSIRRESHSPSCKRSTGIGHGPSGGASSRSPILAWLNHPQTSHGRLARPSLLAENADRR